MEEMERDKEKGVEGAGKGVGYPRGVSPAERPCRVDYDQAGEMSCNNDALFLTR